MNPYAREGASTSSKRVSEKQPQNRIARKFDDVKNRLKTALADKASSAFRQQGFRGFFAILIVTLASALVLGGCTTETADWYGDARFTTEERAAIEQGITWLHAQAGLAPPSFEWGYQLRDSDGPIPKTIRRQRGPATDQTSGQTVAGECLGGALYLDPTRPGATLESLPGLAAHEAAHCELGFVDGYRPNDPPTEGIMRVLVPMRWTDAEQAQCREHADKCPAGRN